MMKLGLDRQQYGELSITYRATMICTRKIEGWFRALGETEQMKELEEKSRASRVSSNSGSHYSR